MAKFEDPTKVKCYICGQHDWKLLSNIEASTLQKIWNVFELLIFPSNEHKICSMCYFHVNILAAYKCNRSQIKHGKPVKCKNCLAFFAKSQKPHLSAMRQKYHKLILTNCSSIIDGSVRQKTGLKANASQTENVEKLEMPDLMRKYKNMFRCRVRMNQQNSTNTTSSSTVVEHETKRTSQRLFNENEYPTITVIHTNDDDLTKKPNSILCTPDQKSIRDLSMVSSSSNAKRVSFNTKLYCFDTDEYSELKDGPATNKLSKLVKRKMNDEAHPKKNSPSDEQHVNKLKIDDEFNGSSSLKRKKLVMENDSDPDDDDDDEENDSSSLKRRKVVTENDSDPDDDTENDSKSLKRKKVVTENDSDDDDDNDSCKGEKVGAKNVTDGRDISNDSCSLKRKEVVTENDTDDDDDNDNASTSLNRKKVVAKNGTDDDDISNDSSSLKRKKVIEKDSDDDNENASSSLKTKKVVSKNVTDDIVNDSCSLQGKKIVKEKDTDEDCQEDDNNAKKPKIVENYEQIFGKRFFQTKLLLKHVNCVEDCSKDSIMHNEINSTKPFISKTTSTPSLNLTTNNNQNVSQDNDSLFNSLKLSCSEQNLSKDSCGSELETINDGDVTSLLGSENLVCETPFQGNVKSNFALPGLENSMKSKDFHIDDDIDHIFNNDTITERFNSTTNNGIVNNTPDDVVSDESSSSNNFASNNHSSRKKFLSNGIGKNSVKNRNNSSYEQNSTAQKKKKKKEKSRAKKTDKSSDDYLTSEQNDDDSQESIRNVLNDLLNGTQDDDDPVSEVDIDKIIETLDTSNVFENI